MNKDSESLVVCFSGRIASGKSSLSALFAERAGMPWAGFGDYVRDVARHLGLDPSDRDILQDLGAYLVKRPEPFCRKVLDQAGCGAGMPCVLDGVRHVTVVEEIRRQVHPAKTVLIYVLSSDATIRRRLHDERIGDINARILEQHSTETEMMAALPDMADLLISNEDGRLDEIVERIMQWLKGEL